MQSTSTPTLSEFNPYDVPYQARVLKDLRKKFDYSNGKTHEVLLSGSVGSAKSLLCAHVVVTHCLFNPGAHVLIGRRSMPSLKDTILKKILEHIGDDIDYEHDKTRGIIVFPNGSRITSYSWGDGHLLKVRSLELSAAMIEELTENEDMDFYKEIRARVGRLPHIKESFIISATNPGGKSSEFYQYFIEPGGPRRHVYYSVTTDNKFLEKGYIEGLLDSYDEKTAQRMIYGQWVDFNTEIIYHAYSREFNFKNESYIVKKNLPVYLCFDFNIGLGKPLSCALLQYDNGVCHVFNEVVVDGQDTNDAMNELFNRGLLTLGTQYIVHGDASGRSRDTRSKKTDYLIIEEFLIDKKVPYRMDVPSKNPLVRDRHILANGLICNSKGERRVFVYRDAPTADKGFTSTRLKKGSQYLEDDSDRWQHISTAISYSLCSYLKSISSDKSEVRELSRFGMGR
jgi:hypothetical protein